MSGAKLTKAQLKALRFVEKRDYPAGQPRAGWLLSSTRTILVNRGLIEERAGTGLPGSFIQKSPIVDLTPAGRKALEENT